MRRFIIPTLAFIALALSSLACSIGSTAVEPTAPPPTVAGRPTPSPIPPPTEPPLQSEHRCGDSVCDGPENSQNCPEDCSAEPIDDAEGPNPTRPSEEQPADGGTELRDAYRILYHLTEHTVTTNDMSGETCYLFNFRRFLDGGHLRADGTENQILELRDHPTSKVTAKAADTYYAISSPNDPVAETFGMAMFNWDVEDQTLWAAGFDGGPPREITGSSDDHFPGGVGTSPGNAHLLHLETRRPAQEPNQMVGAIAGKMNPFVADSSLVLTAVESGETAVVLNERYNRQLFSSFSDVSPDGRFLYTIARGTGTFEFVRLTLDTGEETAFAVHFPGFDWAALDWDQFFPPASDFSYAAFMMSPDETRLAAYKNVFTANLDNPCFSEARHHLWIFDLEKNTLERFENRRGYVVDGAWRPDARRPDASSFALAVVGNSGCYPDYLDSWISTFDPDGNEITKLVEEPESKITTMGWSPGGEMIAYDVYSTDFVGRLKLIDVARQEVREILTTRDLGYDVDRSAPVTFLFADWIVTDRP